MVVGKDHTELHHLAWNSSVAQHVQCVVLAEMPVQSRCGR
jgi:hypothetical protein